jgi:glycosyltransferase involved in cell wall biosynthesis
VISGSRRRRLAVVSDAVIPWNTGGKEQRLHELVRRLPALNYEVTVYTMHWWDGPRTIERDGIRYVALCRRYELYAGERRSVLQALVFALACFRMLTQRFDVLEVDAIPFLPLFPMRIVAWVRRKPLVVTWHEYWGQAYWVNYLGPAGRVAAVLERLCLRLPTRVIAASESTARRLRSEAPARLDLHVVPPGVAVPEGVITHAPAASDALPRLIAVGRLLRNKNVHVVIDAVAEMRKRGVDVELLVVGEGPERDALGQQSTNLGLDDRVTFRRFLPDHDDVLRLVAASQVLMFPSVREGFGMVAIEAMAVGTPVITSDHPDNMARHLVIDGVNGRVCAPDAASLGNAVEDVLADHSSLAAGARDSVAQYDWDKLAMKAASAYAL